LLFRRITLHFKRANGEIVTVEANVGDDIVDVSWEYDLDIEGTFTLCPPLAIEVANLAFSLFFSLQPPARSPLLARRAM
jgi:hypothetical protein